MSIELANNCVVIPHAPNWRTNPRWRRRWSTALGEGVTGAEDRQANRLTPWRTLSFQVLPFHLQERCRLEDRVRAALKSGRAAVPVWGRGTEAAIAGTSVAVSGSAWPWAQGDWVFIADLARHGEEAWEVRQIASVAGPTLTLSSAFSGSYPAGTMVWPVLFGKLSVRESAALTDHHAEVALTVEEPAGEGALSLSNCPPNEDPAGGDGTIPELSCGHSLVRAESKYSFVWAFGLGDVNAYLREQAVVYGHPTEFFIEGAKTIFEIEEADKRAEIAAAGGIIREEGPIFWLWAGGSHGVNILDLRIKIESGVLDPHDPTGDQNNVASVHIYLARDFCVEYPE